MDKTPHKSGFIAVIGRPNVGKSTLINQLIGQKIAIMSDKPQTTRTRILCILTQPDAQVILLDTPGVHKPLSKLGEYMDRSITNTLKEVDAIFFVVDVTEKPGPGERFIMERLEKTKKPVILVLNKIDLVTKEALLPIIAAYSKDREFAAVVPISALGEENLDALLSEAKKHLPEGPRYFPEDMMTDQPERLLCAEIIREKALRNLRDEVPHGIGVEILGIEKIHDQLTEINATIYCERDTHKPIIIGKRGKMLQTIGSEARADIEKLLDTHINLKLWVKIRPGWRDNIADLKTLGYEDK